PVAFRIAVQPIADAHVELEEALLVDVAVNREWWRKRTGHDGDESRRHARWKSFRERHRAGVYGEIKFRERMDEESFGGLVQHSQERRDAHRVVADMEFAKALDVDAVDVGQSQKIGDSDVGVVAGR